MFYSQTLMGNTVLEELDSVPERKFCNEIFS